MPNQAGGYGNFQFQRFSTRPIPVAGTRVLNAAATQALPAFLKIQVGAIPTGYNDLGAVAKGKVEISVQTTVQSIDIGRVPVPTRYYAAGSKGTLKFQLQEYGPEVISFASGGSGIATTGSGYSLVEFGGILGNVLRWLCFDDFDVNNSVNSYPFDQFWWQTPTGQAGGSFSRVDNKEAIDVPVEIELLAFNSNSINRLLQFYAINAAP